MPAKKPATFAQETIETPLSSAYRDRHISPLQEQDIVIIPERMHDMELSLDFIVTFSIVMHIISRGT